ncbi:hypothetical protein Tco_0653336 [Tanacetum coccineum]|uniref:CCHC-type domain-containing protein n=1 Tax=Tanacetum coccineum TaxID=301880 RepID=A0ABQ4X097_9ASTR
MKDAFEQNDVYLNEIERQNDLLKGQLLEASLKYDIELCVLLNHECVDKTLNDELEQVKNKSLEIQEGLKARIKILEKDVKSKLITHVSEKTYAYGAIRAENQNLLSTIFELKARMKNSENVSTSRYVVPTGRVVVPTSRYVVPAGKKDEYEVWAMTMEYWITNNDMNIWKRESKARTTLLQSIPDDHVVDFHYMDDARDIWNAVKARFGGNAESKKMRKSMLKQEFSEFRISESEGLHKGYDRMQKTLSQLNQLKAKHDDEDINLKFLRGLPSSWSQVALTLKTKGRLELLYFDDFHSAFVSTTSTSKKMSYAESPSFSSSTTYSAPSSSKARSHSSGNVLQDVLHSLVAESESKQQVAYEDFEQIDKLDLEEMDIKWQMAMLSVRVNKFEKKVVRKIEFDNKEAARFNKKAVICYKCLQKRHVARECRAKGGNEQRYSSFKIQELGKKEVDTKALITVNTLENWKEHESRDDEGFAPKEYGMVAGCGAICKEGAAKVYSLITGNDTDAAAGEFTLMGMTFEV